MKINYEEDILAKEENNKTEDVILGRVVNCEHLRVRKEPSLYSDVLHVITKDSEVMIDVNFSNGEFYKITTASGLEGYCIKKCISIEEV